MLKHGPLTKTPKSTIEAADMKFLRILKGEQEDMNYA
jgi:hypothetical protein